MNQEKTFLYIHGWASNASIWDKFHTYLPSSASNSMDIGFWGDEKTTSANRCDYLITHSMGILWALKKGIKPQKSIIVINGFTDFTACASPKILRKMQRGLQQNPQAQLKSFYRQSGLQKPSNGIMNVPRLIEGLQWLQDWNITAAIDAIDLPILVLAGAMDSIVPLDVTKSQWQDSAIITHPQAGHALLQTHPQWCAEHIKSWIKTHP